MPKAAYVVISKAEQKSANSLEKIMVENRDALSNEETDLWAMLENPACFFFDWFKNAGDWQKWEAGRIFGPLGEMRFWRRGQARHVVIITDADDAPLKGFTAPLQLDSAEYRDVGRKVHLWHGASGGETGIFEERRLPRILRYPLPRHTARPSLETKEYIRLGVPEFVRFSAVTEGVDA